MGKGRNDIILVEKIKADLIERFKSSKAKNGSIVVTMAIDNVPLIITPDWNFGQAREPELADAFTVYVDVPKGRASVPYMASTSLGDIAYKLLRYQGIDLEDEDGVWIRLMTMAPHYQMPYDMYDEAMRAKILEMQNLAKQDQSEEEELEEELGEEDFYFM